MSEPSLDDALIGRTIAGKFSVEAFIGRGAMGVVYKARQQPLGRKVALKVMKVHGATDAKYAARFKREAKTASLLDHPNLVRVLDFGQEPDGLLYIAMEYLEGRNLLTVLHDEWPLSTDRIVGILSQTLAGIAVAHDMGVVHRDLKPENVMLVRSKDDEGDTTETVKVCDFGVATMVEEGPAEPTSGPMQIRTTSSNTTLTAHGMTVGTPGYMSPEQALGETTDARSDIYAVGVILFQLLTKRLPFEANTALKVMIAHIEQQPPSPSTFEPKIDSHLERVCLKALRKRPEKRYQSARDMRADLRAALERERESGGRVKSESGSGSHETSARQVPTVPPSSSASAEVPAPHRSNRPQSLDGTSQRGGRLSPLLVAFVLIALSALLVILGLLRR